MKTALLFSFVLLSVSSAGADDFTAPWRHKYVPPPAKVAPRAPYDGALPRAARSGNLLQMVNPLAPREYGTGAELVYYDQDYSPQYVPFRGKHGTGIKLFSIEF